MSKRFFGGILSTTKITTSGTAYTGAASGVWNIAQQSRIKQAGNWPKGQGISAPLDPTVTLITYGNQTITLTFTTPSYDGESAIISYTAIAVPNISYTSLPIIATEFAPTTYITLYGLINGISYDVYVYATNVYGSTLNYTTYFARQLPVIPNTDTYYSNTALLLTGNETNNSDLFRDASPLSNTPVLYGTPVVSTSQFVEGFASIYFNGSPSLLYYNQVFKNITTTSTAFTIEFWWYPTSTTNDGGIVLGVSNKTTRVPVIMFGANYLVSNITLVAGVSQITLNTWQHIAISSTSTSMYLFINGLLVNTTAPPTTALSNCALTIGGAYYTGYAYYSTGWVDSVRVTAGIARYTTAFTPSSVITGYNLPLPPTNVIATIGSGQSIISFTPSRFNSAAVTSYTVVSIPGQISVSGPTSPMTVNGLTNGVMYQFRVIATNINGSSTPSTPSNTIQPNPPSIPSVLTITSAVYGNTSAVVSFTLPANFGGSICTYTATSTPGNISATGSTSPVTVTGLTNGTSYTFTMVATNSTGTSTVSNTSATVIPATVPNTPTITDVTSFDHTATITFTPDSNNGGDTVSLFTVTSSPGNISATGAASPITVVGLTNGTAYTFIVTATNKAGTSVASVPSASTTPLPPIPVVTGVAISNVISTLTKSFTISWDVNPECTYQVYDSSNNILTGITTSGQTINQTTSGSVLLSTNTYTVYVRATNLKGSGNSSTVSVTIPKQVITLSLGVQPDYVSGTGTCIINSSTFASAGWDLANQSQPADVNITLSGGIVGSANPYNTALTMDFTGFHGTSTVVVNNIPGVIGYGGAGGASGSNGGSGGTGMAVNSNCAVYLGTFMQYATVTGGGGGGGGGGAYGGSGGTGLMLSGTGPYTIKYPTNFTGGGGGGSCPGYIFGGAGMPGQNNSGYGQYSAETGSVYGRMNGGSPGYPQGGYSYSFIGGTQSFVYQYNGGYAIQGTAWTQG